MGALDGQNHWTAFLIGVLSFAAVAISPATAGADVSVTINGQASAGGNTVDNLAIEGDASSNAVRIDEGFIGDSDLNLGQPPQQRKCVTAVRLCKMVISSPSGVSIGPAGGPCKKNSATQVTCSYFKERTGDHNARIRLGGGADTVRIVQGGNESPVSGPNDAPIPAIGWDWSIDYGDGNDVINGATLLSVPGTNPASTVKVDGGRGDDSFTGNFVGRLVTLFGDTKLTFADCPSCKDRFDLVTFARLGGGTIEAGQDADVVTRSVGPISGGPGGDAMTGSPGNTRNQRMISGGDGDDHLIGSVHGDTIQGGRGNDRLEPLAGDDHVTGGEDNDTFFVEFVLGSSDHDTARDLLLGDAGIDRIIYRGPARTGTGAATGVTVNLLGTNDEFQASTGNDAVRDVENVTATPFDDKIFGYAVDNAIDAGDGRDIVLGNAGNDTIDVADSQLFAPAATALDDTVDAGNGRDSIDSKDGLRDGITCGTSSSPGRDTGNGLGANAFVRDFDAATLDLADDVVTDCEQTTREKRDQKSAAKVKFLRIADNAVFIRLTCARRGPVGCKGNAHVGEAPAVGYDLDNGEKDELRVPYEQNGRTIAVELLEDGTDGEVRNRTATTLRRR